MEKALLLSRGKRSAHPARKGLRASVALADNQNGRKCYGTGLVKPAQRSTAIDVQEGVEPPNTARVAQTMDPRKDRRRRDSPRGEKQTSQGRKARQEALSGFFKAASERENGHRQAWTTTQKGWRITMVRRKRRTRRVGARAGSRHCFCRGRRKGTQHEEQYEQSGQASRTRDMS